MRGTRVQRVRLDSRMKTNLDFAIIARAEDVRESSTELKDLVKTGSVRKGFISYHAVWRRLNENFETARVDS